MTKRSPRNPSAKGDAKRGQGQKMKYAIIALILAFSIAEANAVVYCAAGVYRAGCIRRPVGGVVVAPFGGGVVSRQDAAS
jgi:hypothetical protein